MPWDWHPKLKGVADKLGLDLFSTAFDPTAVDFLEEHGAPAHKVASFELVDIPLLKRIAATGKPVIMSTGMATRDEIRTAVDAVRDNGCSELVLLKCTSSYPAPAYEMNLRAIPDMAQEFDVPVGLSDHSLDTVAAITAVALGACVIEKHLKLSDSKMGPDNSFSLPPDEFRNMVDRVRLAESALGQVCDSPTPSEMQCRMLRRSLFVVENVNEGEEANETNIRSIRPGNGLAPRLWDKVLGRSFVRSVCRGTPLTLDMLEPLERQEGSK
jgi:N-acetylneuraminate synthase